MPQHPDSGPLVRLAATLPSGSPERRTILATIKKLAGTMDDTLARADLVSGALNKSKTADRGPVFKAMQDGIGDFLTEFNNWATDKISEYGVGDLGALRESDLSEDDEAELKVFDQRFKGYGPIGPKLLGLLGEIGESAEETYEVLTNRRDYKLRESVKFGAAKGIHGMVSKMPDGRTQVTDIGRGGISTPGSMGVDAEDLSQVMLSGGLVMPGMIFNMRSSDKTDIGGGVSVRGTFKDRKTPWAPAGTSIYTIVGAKVGPNIKHGAGYAKTTAMRAAVDWKRSVHVELEYILTSADEGDMDTHAINMGAKLSLESLLGAELIDGVAVSKQLVLARFYIKKIKNQMDRMLKPGVAKATWQAVVEMIEDKQNPWKTGGGEDFAVNVPKIIKFLEDTREGQQIMQENGLESMDKRVMQARWKDAVKSLKRQLSQLSDDELLSSLHLTLDGMVDDVPAYIKKIKDDTDLYKTYMSEMRKSASERKTSVKTITASERSAMIRLAATLPVGSPERRALIAGCEKLDVPAMREQCEKSKKDGVQPGKGKSKAKSDGKKKDDGKMPAELLEKFEAKGKKAAKSETYALTDVRTNDVDKVRIALEDAGYKVRPYQHKFSGHSVEMVEVEGDSAGIAKVMFPWIRKGDAQKVKGNVKDHFKSNPKKAAGVSKMIDDDFSTEIDGDFPSSTFEISNLDRKGADALVKAVDKKLPRGVESEWLGQGRLEVKPDGMTGDEDFTSKDYTSWKQNHAKYKKIVQSALAASMPKDKKAADRTWADFNTALAKLMKGLKRDVGATKIKQNGKNSAGNRNIWVTLPNRGTVDVWVEDGQTQLWKLLRESGQSGWGPAIPYGDQTPEQVYKKMVAGLKDIDKKAAGKTAKGKLPEALKEHQFTSEDNPNPKGNDKDGDGETNEPSPVPKKAALIRLAATLPKGSRERKTILRLAAGS